VTLGEWIRDQRIERGLSQLQLAMLANNEISQSAISQYERQEIKEPSLKNIFALSKALDISFKDFPWDIICSELEKTGDGNLGKEKFGLYDLPTADSVRTFEGKTYNLVGFIGIECDTGDTQHVTDLYYRTRTVVADSRVLAKRKNINEDLIRVKKGKRVKVR
jgi:transcriptional regulator with XRE-family HTH domain